MADHGRAAGFAAGGDEGLHRRIGVTPHHHHARPGRGVNLPQQRGQQFPGSDMRRGRHNGARGFAQGPPQVGPREAQAGRVHAEAVGEQNFRKGTTGVAEALPGYLPCFVLRNAHMTRDVARGQFPPPGQAGPHQAAQARPQAFQAAEPQQAQGRGSPVHQTEPQALARRQAGGGAHASPPAAPST